MMDSTLLYSASCNPHPQGLFNNVNSTIMFNQNYILIAIVRQVLHICDNLKMKPSKSCQFLVDETAFGSRKYEKGKRLREGGTQWALTFVEVGPDGKTVYLDIVFLPK